MNNFCIQKFIKRRRYLNYILYKNWIRYLVLLVKALMQFIPKKNKIFNLYKEY